jgi:hypothetical protein
MVRIVEAFAEFGDRMACPSLHKNGEILFENGARSDGHESHAEPPTDPIALLRAKIDYAKAHEVETNRIYQSEYRAIWELAQALKMGAGPGPDEGWQEHLAKLRIAAFKASNRHDTLKAELTALLGKDKPPAELYAAYRENQVEKALRIQSDLSRFRVPSISTK